MRIVKIVCYPLDMLFIGLVYVYKLLISPLKPKSCRFVPTCSSYMIDAIREYSFLKGTYLGLKRLLRCNPKTKGGFDPVPTNLKGEAKWLF